MKKCCYTFDENKIIEYSVVIRTTGKAGEKYQKLLDSIDNLVPKPVEVLVVLPEGNEKPSELLGYETFLFVKKGMISQRIEGLNACKTKYALFCDDDVSFDKEFVQKLYSPVEAGYCKFSAGPLYSFLPSKGINALICTVNASAMPTLFKKNRYCSVLRSSGYSYNRHLKNKKLYYETQSIAWTCFFAEIEAFRNLKLEEECWLDSHNYSALDDQTMFYKAWLMNYKTIVVADAYYIHLDAKTSFKGNRDNAIYSLSFNRFIFWHRFIFNKRKVKLLSRLCYTYKSVMSNIYNFLSLKKKSITENEYSLIKKGFFDAKEYVKSDEYLKLPKI